MKRWLKNLWTMCWRCGGYGVINVRGERIPRDQLTNSQWADEMVNGGQTFRVETRPCIGCHGTGLRARYREEA